jgi:hypothetical protein
VQGWWDVVLEEALPCSLCSFSLKGAHRMGRKKSEKKKINKNVFGTFSLKRENCGTPQRTHQELSSGKRTSTNRNG